MNQQLEQIKELIRARRFQEARQALQTYLARHPQDAEAWYLRSFAESSRDQKIVALRRAVKFSPDHEKALARLEQLQPLNKRKSSSLVPLVILFLILVVILVVAVLLLNGRTAPEIQIPTELALNNLVTAQATETTVSSIPATAPPATAKPSSIPVSSPVVSPATSTAASSTAPATEIINPTATMTAVEVHSLLPPSATLASTVVSPAAPPLVFTPTWTVTPIPTAALTLPPPPSDPGVPVGVPLDIGIGQLRVVQMTRPATSAIQQLGGSVPPAPAGQNWVLLELLLICTSPNDCLQSQANFQVLGASGTWYGVASGVNLSPIFDTVILQGQAWGYLGFLVPDSEATLRFAVLRGSQVYVFSLQ